MAYDILETTGKSIMSSIPEDIMEMVEARDDAAYKMSLWLPLTSLISELQQQISLSDLASYTGISEARSISEWGKGLYQPRHDSEMRLRTVARIAFTLDDQNHPRVAESWLAMPSPWLDWRVPGSLLGRARFNDPEDTFRIVMNAAWTSLAGYLCRQQTETSA